MAAIPSRPSAQHTPDDYDGGGASCARSSAAIQSFFITWANSNIRAARSTAPSNTTRISPGLSVITSL